MKLRIAMAQTNPTVGDIAGNAELAVKAVRHAKAAGAHIVALPEMFLTGYPTNDLLFEEGFVQENERVLREIVLPETDGIAAVVGFVKMGDPSRTGYDGPEMFNCAAVLQDGRHIATVKKTLLPNYDVFDEKRYFRPGKPDEISPIELTLGDRSFKIGVQICEDLWDEDYSTKVTSELCRKGADFFINISASPFWVNKGAEREDLVRSKVAECRAPFIYVNMVGGQDELVYDGQSFAADRGGNIIARAAAFEEEVHVFDLDADSMSGDGIPRPAPCMEEEVVKAHILNLRDYIRKIRIFKGVVLGLSGGVDSAYAAYIAAEAIGPRNVMCIAMPSKYSTSHSLTDAEDLARNLGVQYKVAAIKDMYDAGMKTFTDVFGESDFGLAEENDQPRYRMMLLMKYSMKNSYLVCTTGNKSELSTGYFTMFGDGAGGKNIPGDVYKTDLYKIVRWINREREIIPHNIIDKPPSAELKPDQYDTDSLPDYEVLDRILKLLVEEHLSMAEIIARGNDPEAVKKTFTLYKRSEFKRDQMPRGIKISRKAFGVGRRMPICNRW